MGKEYKAPNQLVAESANLQYTADSIPGIRRSRGLQQDFQYHYPDGTRVTSEIEQERIQKLGIPPAYTDVWICTVANGHLQATGRDSKGRKQYRYHAKWREVCNETKFERMISFGEALPRIRTQVQHDLKLRNLSRTKVLATVVQLLESTRIRIGNEEYAETNHHYGLTTLRNRHVKVDGGNVDFTFVGKSGVRHQLHVHNRRLAKIVESLRDLPGQELFQFVDGETGQVKPVRSDDVNEYIQQISGEHFTAKDFRTWSGTVLCAVELANCDNATTPKEIHGNVTQAIKTVATHLGNTPTVCRTCYIHPAVLMDYMESGALGVQIPDLDKTSDTLPEALLPEEEAVLNFLKDHSISQSG